MNTVKNAETNRAIVIGGSLGGLFAATMLARVGWQVDVFERSGHDLDSRGGGIVLQPDVVEVLKQAGTNVADVDLGVLSRNRTVFRPDGSILTKQVAPQTQTSWSLVYSMMREAFDKGHYHTAKNLIDLHQNDECKTVTAYFADGSQATGDLLVGADGNGSTVRQLLWPDDKPDYAGYLAWRGLVPEQDLPSVARDDLLGDFGFSNNKGSHILGYLVPGASNDTRAGHRLYNWVWYRVADDTVLRNIMTDKDGLYRGFSMPEGKLAEQWKPHLHREADNLLPPGFRAAVQATNEPYAQAIRDLTVETMVKGRVVLLGDAAFIPRPHTAASTSKAAANALALAEALDMYSDDIDRGLKRWEPHQLKLGNFLFEQGIRAGDHLLFNRVPAARAG